MSDKHPGGRVSWADLALLLTSIVVCALILEWAARALFSDKIGLFPRNHAGVQYGRYTIRRLTPNVSFWQESIDGRWRHRTNAQGYRADRDFVLEKPPGAFRVLVLGDSHTQGSEVHQHETFSAVLEKRLKDHGINADVMNAGVTGFSTAEELVYLENEGLRYQPDVVVIAMFANDFLDNVRSRLFKVQHGQLATDRYEYAPGVRTVWWTQTIPGLAWLGEHSYAYSMLFNGLWISTKFLQRRQAALEFAVDISNLTDGKRELASLLLLRAASSAQRAGARIVLVDVPKPANTTATYRTSIEPTVRQAVAASFDAVVWSEHYLSGLAAGDLAHLPHGQFHINARTHRLLAEALTATLLTMSGNHSSVDSESLERSRI